MNIRDRELWTREIKKRYPEKYYAAYEKKPEINLAGNYELLERIKKLEKEIQELKTQNLNLATRIFNLEMKK